MFFDGLAAVAPVRRRPLRMNRSSLSRCLMIALALATFGCVGEPTASPEASGLDREAFIATYVDLRTATIRGETYELTDTARARILSDHGVTEDDLLGFVDARGADVAFMREVWDEVEARLDAVRLVPGSATRR